MNNGRGSQVDIRIFNSVTTSHLPSDLLHLPSSIKTLIIPFLIAEIFAECHAEEKAEAQKEDDGVHEEGDAEINNLLHIGFVAYDPVQRNDEGKEHTQSKHSIDEGIDILQRPDE
jgi:hypothetical protein